MVIILSPITIGHTFITYLQLNLCPRETCIRYICLSLFLQFTSPLVRKKYGWNWHENVIKYFNIRLDNHKPSDKKSFLTHGTSSSARRIIENDSDLLILNDQQPQGLLIIIVIQLIIIIIVLFCTLINCNIVLFILVDKRVRKY